MALALVGIGLVLAAPALATIRSAGRAAAGARHLASAFQALRWKSVAQHRSHGLLFERDRDGWFWWEVRDGNGNGLRTAEVRAGTDAIVGGPHRLEARVEHARLGFPPGGPIPRIPPAPGWLDTTDPVQFGRSDLIAFGPLGTASSGTLYVSDGRHRVYGVVLYGRATKLVVWRYDTRDGKWRH